jgi:antitoxin component of RelBE/YafQ-DinJ toxin-antitoxin module
MTTTFQIRLDEDLKRNFLNASKEKGLDGSMLIRHFMSSFSNQPEIVNFDIQESFFDDIMKDKQIIAKLEKVSDKLDTLWF